MATERERLRGGNLITPEEIELISGYDTDVAKREHENICEQLGIENGQLTVKAYCTFCDLDYDEIVSFLNPTRRGNKVTKGEAW
jgi:hypothetical protein